MAVERNINQIFSNKLFENCSDRLFSYNLSNRNFTEYREGDIIFQAGDSSNFIYLIVSGEVKIKFRNVNKLLLKKSEDFFGDIEITKNSNRNSSAVAVSDSVLYRLDRGTFNKLCQVEKQVIENVDRTQKEELKDLSETRPKADIPSVLKLDSSPIKLDIFKRKKKDEPKVGIDKKEDPVNNPAKDTSTDDLNKENQTDQEIPDLDSVIQEIKSNQSEDESLKKELLGDSEDFSDWQFTTLENTESLSEEKIEFEEVNPEIDEKLIRQQLSEKHSRELNELRVTLTQKYTSYFQSISKLLPGINADDTCQKVVSVFMSHFNANFSALFLVDEKTSDLNLVYPQSAMPLTASFDKGLTGKAASGKKLFVVRNPSRDLRFNPAYDHPKGFKEGSVAYIPLNDSEQKLVGVIQLAKTMKDFSKENEEALKVLAEQAGVVIRHSLMNEELFKKEKIAAFGSISRFLMQDIKSPILTIKHYSNLISRIDIPDQIKKVLTMLSMQANSVVDIMQATFDFAEDNSSVKLQKVRFNENLENILELLSEYTESRNVKLFRKFGDDYLVNIDPRRFYVVCFQVIKNACEAMPSGGKIFVNTEVSDNFLSLNIRDEGPGINDEIKNDIFNAFFTSGKENASGLGLAIAKYLTTLMHGTISFESKFGEGTKMIISLPIAEE